VNEIGGLVEADHLTAPAEYRGKVIPGNRADVYFASSKK
jgi:hypothetical protein